MYMPKEAGGRKNPGVLAHHSWVPQCLRVLLLGRSPLAAVVLSFCDVPGGLVGRRGGGGGEARANASIGFFVLWKGTNVSSRVDKAIKLSDDAGLAPAPAGIIYTQKEICCVRPLDYRSVAVREFAMGCHRVSCPYSSTSKEGSSTKTNVSRTPSTDEVYLFKTTVCGSVTVPYPPGCGAIWVL